MREDPFTYCLAKMQKAVGSKRTTVHKMNSYEDFEKWLKEENNMLTAKDLNNQINLVDTTKSKIIDTWLSEIVFPEFRENGQEFPCPDGVSLSAAKTLLKRRGFSVETFCDYEGAFIYITIPAQEE